MKKYSFKRIDSTTSVLLVFIVFLVALFIYLTQLNKQVHDFSVYNNTVNRLKIMDKQLDNFLLQKSTFTNYDKINKTVSDIRNDIEFLDSDISRKIFPKQYIRLLQNLTKNFKIKIDSVEYFKSEHAQFLYSIYYLFDQNNIMSKLDNKDNQNTEVLSKILLDLMKYYLNTDIDSTDIVINLEYLAPYAVDNILMMMFIKHVELNIKRIERFKNIQGLQKQDRTEISLEKFYLFLNSNYEKNILIEKVIITILFIVALVILFILMLMNRRSLSMRDELLGFKTAIENSYNSIIITDVDSNITYVNDVALKETGYLKGELIGKNPRMLKSGMNKELFYEELHGALSAGKKWEGEFINRKKDGSLLYEKASIMPVYQYGKLTNYLAIKLNITDYVQAKEKVEHMAYHDTLTSLPNRANIEEYLSNRLLSAKRMNLKIDILFIDLDRFKTINDTLGHDVGDELLIECAKRIRSALRSSDMLARVGGDEFIVVVESSANNYTAAHVCEKILELFSEPIQTKEHLLNITLSIGISVFPDDDDSDYKKLFKYADIAMYEAKNSGKNTYRYYQKQLSIEAHDRLDMEQALKVALDNSELYMVYQPKYNLEDKTVVGLEALVRWNSAKLGNVRPDHFISVAEDTGYILEIGLFIFEKSCRDFLIFQKLSDTLKTISINISTVQLYQESFVDELLSIVRDVGIAPEVITLEITETHIMKNVKQSIRLLKNLKEYGFSISIDDFGTGHSSLSYLKLFLIDELKIDKSFVDDLPYDKNDVAIAKAIITLSKSMGYINVAEGIENEAQEQFLQENNCKIGQGYLFCKPKAKDELIDFLDNKKNSLTKK